MYEVDPNSSIKEYLVLFANSKILLTLVAFLVSLSLIGCGELGERRDKEPKSDAQIHTELADTHTRANRHGGSGGV